MSAIIDAEPTNTACSVAVQLGRFRYERNGRVILEQSSFEITPGQLTFLFGVSGSGKTTLLRLLHGSLIHPDTSISYRVGSRTFTPAEAKRKGIVGFLSQSASLLPWASIHKNLLLPSTLNSALDEPDQSTIDHMLSVVGLADLSQSTRPHKLSFGMQRRIAFARALLYGPRVLFLDEAFTGLDSYTAALLARYLADYVTKTHAACVIVTHDASLVSSYADNFVTTEPRGIVTHHCEAPDISQLMAFLASSQEVDQQ